MFTLMQATKGFKLFVERSVEAMIKELKQLVNGNIPRKYSLRQSRQIHQLMRIWKKYLDAVNIIKEKRDGKINGRTCAKGSKQKRYLKKGRV